MPYLRLPSRTAQPTSALAKIKRDARRRLRAQAVSQGFDGTLRVDPDKVYIDEATGRRAVAALQRMARKR